jgi:ketosteroid isomerase-like protein
MSQENVEFVEGLLAGVGNADKQALLAALPGLIAQACAPDVEWVEDPQRPDSRVFRGHAGVQESFERWLEQWDEYGFEVDRLIDAREGVLVVAREKARGKTSGARITARIYSIFTFREGKIARYQEFYDERAAIEAAGLVD